MNAPAPVESALTDAVKEEIQSAYRHWLASRGFRPRRGQREMIAAIARTLALGGERLLVVEAGTGTGKTAAYCMAAIPIARSLGKTVVISSATVALQEQIVLRDLPDLKENTGLEFSFALAKGRGRYVCLKRLDDSLRYADQQEIPIFGDNPSDHAPLYQEMLTRFGDRRWNGEIDDWSDVMDDDAWRSVTTDHRGCTNNRCSFFKQCPFFRARGNLEDADVIVANHDLVLADLSLGGGAVLPDTADCVFIIDEAHHLPEKTQSHFSVRMRMQGTIQWTDNVNATVGSLTQRFARPDELVAIATRLTEDTAGLQAGVTDLHEVVSDLDYVPRDDTLDICRFPLGEVPDTIADAAMAALPFADAVLRSLDDLHNCLSKALAGEMNWEKHFEAEDWLPPVGQLVARAQTIVDCLRDFSARATSRSPTQVPSSGRERAGLHARWVNRFDTDLELVSAPIEPGHLLAEVLWSQAYAAISTSATLTALGSFDRFRERAGLSETVSALRIPSPFDFPNIASLHVPAMSADPRDFDGHTAEIVRLMPELLASEHSALVLFTSWRQMNAVVAALPTALVEQLLIQGEGSKQALLVTHRERIDAGGSSYLFGLASFAEGVDLPDDYCRHVIIVKLPFAVPDDPIDQAMAEYAESRGRNAFYDISVPDAALKLVQACGRLIRHEGDYGRITLLDRRVVTQRYGRVILDALPPYRRELSRQG